jgi:signal peptidase I
MQFEEEIVGKDVVRRKPIREVQDLSEVRTSVRKSALLLLRDIAIAIGVIILILQFVKPTIVFEHSMEDTLHPQDYVFLSRQAYLVNDVQYGDIIVFKSALMDDNGTYKNLIKRIIGLPGDVISIQDESVYRNGERLNEPYTKEGVTLGEMAPVTVPNNAYFVLGDNRQVSTDSRSGIVGFVSEDRIEGKVFFRLFPISTAGRVG